MEKAKTIIPGLLRALLFSFLIIQGASAAPATNVLFLIADDLNCDLGCYGHPQVKTPHLDALAAHGVRFQRAYCQFPLCSPSRASLLTGRRPDVTRVLSNPPAGDSGISPHLRDAIPQTVTLPQLFKNNGARSLRIGKLYHAGVPLSIGTGSADDFGSWDQAINPRGCDRDDLDQVFSLEPGRFGGTLSWLAHQSEDEAHTDGIAAKEAVGQLEAFSKSKKPFFLAVGFFRPHTPYVAPRKYFELYPTSLVTLPTLSEADRRREPAEAYASSKKEQDKMSDEQRKAAIQAYWASISFMDAQAGKILAALDRLGLRESTTVVFTSDHGYHLGDHGLWQKRSLFERSARVPLIIDSPLTKARGTTAPGVVELVDLYPTLADLANLPRPCYLAGQSLRPVLDDPSHRAKDVAFTQVDRKGEPGRSVRDERWRYTEWANGQAELHDYETDPDETRNHLAEQPDVARRLAARLARGLTEAPPAHFRVQKIWDQAPHNAFTDLVRFRDKWFCVFREGGDHVSPDGKLRVLTLSDENAERWESAALLSSPEGDLRDAKICVTPDKRLMLSGAVALPSGPVKHRSLAWFSEDGRSWSEPRQIGQDNYWLWRVTWHGEDAWSVGYPTDYAELGTRLFHAKKGGPYEVAVSNLLSEAQPNESALLFLPDGQALCLLRREQRDWRSALGSSREPFTQWTWRELNASIGGPHMIRLPDGRIIVAGRDHRPQAKTVIWGLDVKTARLSEIAELPSGGDCSYPGLVWHEGELWVSYYSSHEGKASIYLARLIL